MRDPSSNRQISYERQSDIHDWPRALEGYNLCQRNRSNKNKMGGDVELYIPHTYAVHTCINIQKWELGNHTKYVWKKIKGEKNKSNNSDAIRRVY